MADLLLPLRAKLEQARYDAGIPLAGTGQGVHVYDPPRYLGNVKGDDLYLSVTDGRLSFICRDWRVSAKSSQHHPDTVSESHRQRRIANVAANRPHFHRSLAEWAGRISGAATYCVLGGPSVERDAVEHTPRQSDFVIGVNRGIGYARCGAMLVADAVVRFDHVRDWLRGKPKPEYLLACAWADPSLREGWAVDSILWFIPAGRGHEIYGLPTDLPEIEYRHNTGSMVLNVSDLLGASEIVLIGSDLACTGGYFWPGIRAHVEKGARYIVTEDLDGYATFTRSEMWFAARGMESWAWILKHKYGVKCVNLTGGGILKKNWDRERG